jgi:glycosyltransferase involved in cell wall biosynthesis
MASPRRVRVAFCLDSFAIGGTELNAVRTAEALDHDRIELHIFHLSTRGPLCSRYERLGVRMTHVPISNLYSPRTAVQGIRLARLLRRENVDVVHSHDIYSNIFFVPWARMLTGCSIIASRRWWYEAPRPGLVTVNRWTSALAHRVVANSSGVAQLLAREENVPTEKIVEIPNFLAESAFVVADEGARIAQKRAWGLPEGAFAIGIVARLSPVKNHALLLKAVAHLDARFHLVVIGDGPSRAELEERARQLRIESRVHFAGEVVSGHNLHECFDVSVLCSLSEGFPNSVIEAMAAARAVVATPVGGVTDAITHGVTGMLVSVDDPAPLVDALRMLESDPQLRARLGKTAREAVRAKFRQDIVIEKLSALYERLSELRRAASFGRAYG